MSGQHSLKQYGRLWTLGEWIRRYFGARKNVINFAAVFPSGPALWDPPGDLVWDT